MNTPTSSKALHSLIQVGGAIKFEDTWFAVAEVKNPLSVWVGRQGMLGSVPAEGVDAIKSPEGKLLWEKQP